MLHTGAVGSEPCTLVQALASPNANQWKQAYQIKLDQLKKLCTWDIVSHSVDKQLHLQDKAGSYWRSLEVQGLSHCRWPQAKEGYNYDETFATAAKIASIHVLLALAAQCNLEIDQIDIVSTYLNADLKDKVYMEAPDSILNKGEHGKVCCFVKRLVWAEASRMVV